MKKSNSKVGTRRKKHNVSVKKRTDRRKRVKGGDELTTFIEAIISDEYDGVVDFIDNGMNVNQQEPVSGYTPLIYAIKLSEPDMVDLLLAYQADVNITDNNNKSPLLYAIERQNRDIIRLLLNHNADVNKEDDKGKTPLMYAIQHNDIQTILDLGVIDDLDPNQGDTNGVTPLMYAVHKQNPQIIFILLDDLQVDINKKDNHGHTALMYATRTKPDLVILLAENGADLNTTDRHGFTALNHAIYKQDPNIVTILIDMGLDVNHMDNIQRSILYFAMNTQNDNIIIPLIRAGARDPRIDITEYLQNNETVPRNNVPIDLEFGTCFDIFELEDINAKDFLTTNKNHVLIIEGNTVSCGLRKNFRNLPFFYECRSPTGYVRSDNVIRETKYAKVGTLNVFVSKDDLSIIGNRDYSIFKLVPSERLLTAVVSEDVMDRQGTWIGADHCQEGSGGRLYYVEAYNLRNGQAILRNIRSGGQSKTKKRQKRHKIRTYKKSK